MELLVLLLSVALFVLFLQLNSLKARVRNLETGGAAIHGETLPPVETPEPEPVAEAVYVPFEAEPAPEPPANVEQEWQSDPAREGFGGLFERWVAGRLLIWIGGAALFVAGILLIRYSIEVGLVTPAARMIGAAAFGLLLVGVSEYARGGRFADDPRIHQVLAGAGLAILYATPYASYVLYHLIGTGTASAAMIAVTAAALVMSLRHGAPTAIMGLIGGFLTPALVGNSDSGALPLLAYLALLDMALFAIAWRRGWTWLAAAAVLLSLVWSGFLLVRPPQDALAAGAFALLLGLAGCLVRPGEGRQLRLIQPLAIAAVQLAFLVARTDLGPEAWALFGALSAAAIVLALVRSEYRLAPPAALGLALLLLAGKAASFKDGFIEEAALGITMLFGAAGLALALWRDRLLWTAVAVLGLSSPVMILRVLRPELFDSLNWGALSAALAIGPAILIWANRKAAKADMPSPALLLACAAAALLAGSAVWDLAPPDLIAVGWLSIALALALVARRLDDRAPDMVALAAAAAAALRALAMVPDLWEALAAAPFGYPVTAAVLPGALPALYSLALPALLLALLHRALPPLPPRARWAPPALAGSFAVAALYVWFKQGFGLGEDADFAARGLLERTILTQALFAAGWVAGSGWLRVPRWAGTMLTAIAAARMIWFDLLIFNPAFAEQWVGAIPVLNLILPAYLLSAVWLYAARRRAEAATRSGFWLIAFLAALIAGVALEVRQGFQGPILSGPETPIAEFYAYSLAGLAVAIALILAGMRLPDKALRLAGLVLLTATILKVFLVDASELEGVLRILSFLGLGIALIGIGRIYGPILRAERGES